jgi:hypothetical protein
MSAFIFLIVFGKEQSGSLEVAVYDVDANEGTSNGKLAFSSRR